MQSIHKKPVVEASRSGIEQINADVLKAGNSLISDLLLDPVVDFGDPFLLAGGGQNADHLDAGFRLSGANGFDHAGDACGDLGGRVSADVVRTCHQHDPVDRTAVQFVVVDSPQHVLDPVPSAAHVAKTGRRHDSLPTAGAVLRIASAGTSPVMGNRVADQYGMRFLLAVCADQLPMPLLPIVSGCFAPLRDGPGGRVVSPMLFQYFA